MIRCLTLLTFFSLALSALPYRSHCICALLHLRKTCIFAPTEQLQQAAKCS